MEEEFYYLFLTHDYIGYLANRFHDVFKKLKEETSVKKFLLVLVYYLFSSFIKFNPLTIRTSFKVLLYFVL
ncbi:hypothetical protein J5U22_01919 [Saccharolobus shibatae]|uniref:Uncharacterized protein n=1 Tax=Saccharolobus shibatae TaxID=2286 RepID=A0A8F5BVM4_9CREN|nr:hypothetical protein J5U21_01968 [Saccharolobus shibatae]QXJ35372.1 hypothetical protein J5U22_01919 [Saccharolobus shibatae]